MAFTRPKLPYPKDALASYMCEETLGSCYDKHHQAYVNILHRLTEGTLQVKASLEELIHTADGALFNNAAQGSNHTFF
jgi:superoxide dismutase, Fe-Mn family